MTERAKGTSGVSIKRLFIANRGEICRRIATTAKRLGIEVVAVTDRLVPPAYLHGLVDYFVKVEEENTQLYLDGVRMIDCAKRMNCDAVHPGFGFLSENASFAKQVIDSGMTWVGPSPSSIDAMASKARAREIAIANHFPCIEALQGFKVDDSGRAHEEVKTFAKKVGYPLLVKAALGGGGKGMRLVHQDGEIEEALSRASSEALKSFADATLVVEKYLGSPRHVEVQILGDQHGFIAAIGDRDCSVQRRHQKVLEEAPAPCLTPATRQAIHNAARVLAKAVNYYSAGTIELLVDGSSSATGNELQKFYFLEMNTRLQVEHPVTEEVFGVDLVEWQLRIAQGERLPESFAKLEAKGHSIEARIYAENVDAGFLPSPGPLYGLKPDLGTGIRWEIGLDTIDEITAKFDPMVAKIIATGPCREAALDRLAGSLERTLMAAKATNVPLVIAAARDSMFRQGGVTTHYLKDREAYLADEMKAHRAKHQAIAEEIRRAWLEESGENGSVLVARDLSVQQLTNHIFATSAAVAGRSTAQNLVGAQKTYFGAREVHLDPQYPQLKIVICHGFTHDAARGYQGFYVVSSRDSLEKQVVIGVAGENFSWTTQYQKASGRSSSVGVAGGDLVAPLPGKVVSVHVTAGQSVVHNQRLFVMESMKMELEVKAPKTGTIGKVLIAVGQTIGQGVSLATWETEVGAEAKDQ